MKHFKSVKLVLLVGAVFTALLAVAVASAISGFSDVQANSPQVAGVNNSNLSARFPTNKQNEPTIAVNPTNSKLLIAGSNDEQEQPACGAPVRQSSLNDCSFFPGVGTSGIYTSSDGGATWKNRGLLDDQPGWKASPYVSDGDPVIVYGPKPTKSGFSYANGARAYYATLASFKPGQSPYPPNKAPELLVVSYSDDNGGSWSAPAVVTIKDNPNDFNDKESLWVDKLPGSPYFGQAYVSWTEFRSASGEPSEPIMVAVSSDGGNTFGAPKQLSQAGNNGTGNGRQGSAVRSGPDGSVYVAWEQASAQVVSISRDGGTGWTRPITIGAVSDLKDPIPGSNFRTDSFLSIAADPRSGSATLYAAWANDTATGGRIVVSTSTDKGLTWSAPVTVSTAAEGYAFYQGLDVAPNGRVDIGYQAQLATNPNIFGTGNARIDSWFVSKPTGGSWSAPVRVTTKSSDPAASAQNNLERQFFGDYNTLVSDNTTAWFIYTDTRNGAGCPAVDNYQSYLASQGLARDDEEDLVDSRHGKDSSVSSAVAKPAPPTDCPAQFGNSDAFVSVVKP